MTPSPTATEISSTPTKTVIPFDIFVEGCKKEPGRDVACIYSEGVLALHIKMGDGKDIPYKEGTAQIWSDAWREGEVIGILAHDNFEGQKFFKLYEGRVISLIWPDGTVEKYVISEKTRWRYEDEKKFFSPWEGGDKISSQDLARLYYLGGANFNKMVLQTCIDTNVGVLFVVAYRLK